MDFDCQHLGAAVGGGGIFGHAAIRAVIQAARMRDGHEQAVWSHAHFCPVATAPEPLREGTPLLRVLKGTSRTDDGGRVYIKNGENVNDGNAAPSKEPSSRQ